MPNVPATLQKIERDLASRFESTLKIREKPSLQLIPSGIRSISFPRGTLTEIFGPSVSGKTSVLIEALAQATHHPECCALVDASDSFDPASAERAGVYLPHLLWIRCSGNVEAALKTADLLAHASGFGIVAIDLAGVPTQQARRISLASWFRLRHAVRETPTALVVVENELNAHSCSTLQIEHRPVRFEIRGNLLRGISTRVAVGRRQKATSELRFQRFYQL